MIMEIFSNMNDSMIRLGLDDYQKHGFKFQYTHAFGFLSKCFCVCVCDFKVPLLLFL